MILQHLTVEADGQVAPLEAWRLGHTFDGAPRGAYPAILICPGGGYAFTSDREADPVAVAFCNAGFHAFVLRYSVAPEARYPTALRQAARAMALIRSHAEEWGVDPHRIAVCGFSAGGHLAASLSTLWNDPAVRQVLCEGQNARPDASVLCYPVITGGEFCHDGSFVNLLGEQNSPAMRRQLSLETQVRPDTPPAFLWHTVADDCVPVENSLLYASALRQAGVAFEMHLYEPGGHGLSLCTAVTQPAFPDCAGWFDLAVRFLQRRNV